MKVGPAPFSDFKKISPLPRRSQGLRKGDVFLVLLMMVLMLAFETAVGICAVLDARVLLPAAG